MDILLIDGNSLGYTQFHTGMPTVLPSGLQTQAIDGFIRAISFNLYERPNLLPVVLWDGRADWRYQILPEYKSNRNKTPQQRADREAYAAQVQYIQKLLKHLGVIQIKPPGAEADDIAFQICRILSKTNHHVELLSTDTDWWQFIAANIEWQGCRKLSPHVTLDNFQEKSGYESPATFIQGKALKGDGADEIDGVVGVGEKTAQQTMRQFHTKDAFYQAVAEGQVDLTTKRMKNLVTEESSRLWDRNLLLMDLSKAPRISIADLQILPGSLNREGLLRLAAPLGIGVIMDRIDELMLRFDKHPEAKAEFLHLLNQL